MVRGKYVSKDIKDRFGVLLEKAIDNRLDIMKLREKILKNSGCLYKDILEDFMYENFSVWKNMETIVERERLLSLVNNCAPSRQMLQQNAL